LTPFNFHWYAFPVPVGAVKTVGVVQLVTFPEGEITPLVYKVVVLEVMLQPLVVVVATKE